ncbi:MAG: nucleotidyltransferase family protein [Burkholderiales bacterium]
MISGILLAAGSASRFGGGKIAHPLADGTPVGIAAFRNLKSALDDTLVVIRAGDSNLLSLFKAEGATVVECADAHLGMSRSLIAGISAAARANGWIVALGDMPYVKSATIRALARALGQGAAIAIPTHAGRRGNPVGFSAAFRAQLLALSGDEGARAVVKAHAADVVEVECEDPGILRDIDTRTDIEADR